MMRSAGTLSPGRRLAEAVQLTDRRANGLRQI